MRRACLIIIMTILTIAETFSQQVHGSFAIGAICKDGILLAEDTRGAFSKDGILQPNNQSQIKCYFDPIQKIYPFNGFAVCSMGLLNFAPEYNSLYYYLSKYINSAGKNVTVMNFIYSFYLFIHNNYPDKLNAFASLNI